MSLLYFEDDDELNASIEKCSMEDSVFIDESIKNLKVTNSIYLFIKIKLYNLIKECKYQYPQPNNKKIIDDQVSF